MTNWNSVTAHTVWRPRETATGTHVCGLRLDAEALLTLTKKKNLSTHDADSRTLSYPVSDTRSLSSVP